MQHFVYALTDPVSEDVKYVGITDNAARRFYQHCRDARKSLDSKSQWIQGLRDARLLPGLKILEIVATEGHAQAKEREWIQYYQAQGGTLLNSILIYNPPLMESIIAYRKPALGVKLLAALALRKERGIYNLNRLAKDSSISYPYLHHVFHGQSLPSREILVKICKVLGCSHQEAIEIFDETDYRAPSPDELEEERPVHAA